MSAQGKSTRNLGSECERIKPRKKSSKRLQLDVISDGLRRKHVIEPCRRRVLPATCASMSWPNTWQEWGHKWSNWPSVPCPDCMRGQKQARSSQLTTIRATATRMRMRTHAKEQRRECRKRRRKGKAGVGVARTPPLLARSRPPARPRLHQRQTGTHHSLPLALHLPRRPHHLPPRLVRQSLFPLCHPPRRLLLLPVPSLHKVSIKVQERVGGKAGAASGERARETSKRKREGEGWKRAGTGAGVCAQTAKALCMLKRKTAGATS